MYSSYPDLVNELKLAVDDPELAERLLFQSCHLYDNHAERFKFTCAITEQDLEATFISMAKIKLNIKSGGKGFILLEGRTDATGFGAAFLVRFGAGTAHHYAAFRQVSIPPGREQEVYKHSDISRPLGRVVRSPGQSIKRELEDSGT